MGMAQSGAGFRRFFASLDGTRFCRSCASPLIVMPAALIAAENGLVAAFDKAYT
jgi:hypothetical protein